MICTEHSIWSTYEVTGDGAFRNTSFINGPNKLLKWMPSQPYFTDEDAEGQGDEGNWQRAQVQADGRGGIGA